MYCLGNSNVLLVGNRIATAVLHTHISLIRHRHRRRQRTGRDRRVCECVVSTLQTVFLPASRNCDGYDVITLVCALEYCENREYCAVSTLARPDRMGWVSAQHTASCVRHMCVCSISVHEIYTHTHVQTYTYIQLRSARRALVRAKFKIVCVCVLVLACTCVRNVPKKNKCSE